MTSTSISLSPSAPEGAEGVLGGPGGVVDKGVTLDACCLLNLCATGRFVEIVDQLPYRFFIGPRARAEAQWLRIPGVEEREPVDLQPFLGQGLLEELFLQGQSEQSLFIQFAVLLADGEAEAAALAVSRGHLLATDDLKARRVVAESHPAARLLSTLEMLHEWHQSCGVPITTLRDVLRRVAYRATYRPRRADPLWGWWTSLVGDL